ncbi:MAG: glycoside hydrolase family 1 protein [Oscillospiraceae bacterium]
MNEFKLKNNMLLGVASSATQVDGGDLRHTWNDWHEKGRIKDGSDPAVATDHWNRWREDVLLMHRMGIQTYRLSIEWARVEPAEGCFDEEAIRHIKEEILLLIGLGIKPLVTLHHFTNPLWFEEKGGWENYENIRYFLIYVEKMVKSIGHLVNEYLTLNEPNIYAVNGYFFGTWPPGKKSMSTALNVMSNLATAHIKAYRLIHDVRRGMGFKDSRVSFANHLRVFEPKNRLNPAHVTSAALAERTFQTRLTEAMLTGEFKKPLKNVGRVRHGAYCDFHAVDYYTRSTITGLADGVREDCCKNDLGWEIYPEGIVRCCRKLMEIAPLPIYITENGTCDLNDSFRSRFIYDHLKALCQSGLPVKRYYHWSFNDSFEWAEGSFARFGLVHTNYETLERTVKRSGEFYSAIIKNHGVTQEMYDEFVAGQEYHH